MLRRLFTATASISALLCAVLLTIWPLTWFIRAGGWMFALPPSSNSNDRTFTQVYVNLSAGLVTWEQYETGCNTDEAFERVRRGGLEGLYTGLTNTDHKHEYDDRERNPLFAALGVYGTRTKIISPIDAAEIRTTAIRLRLIVLATAVIPLCWICVNRRSFFRRRPHPCRI